MKTPLIAGNSDHIMVKTISSQDSNIRVRFNDYPVREYTQASGNGENPTQRVKI